MAEKLQGIKQQHGADAIGGIGSTKLSNESNYLLQRFMRQLIGTNNVDHRDGGDVAALPTGLPALADVMKPQYGPDPKHDVIFLFGIDPSEELPMLDLHLKRAVRRGKAQADHRPPAPDRTDPLRRPVPAATSRARKSTLLNGLLRHGTEASRTTASTEAHKLRHDASDARSDHFCGVDADAAARGRRRCWPMRRTR